MKLLSHTAALLILALPAPLLAQEPRWPLADSTKSPTKALDIGPGRPFADRHSAERGQGRRFVGRRHGSGSDRRQG